MIHHETDRRILRNFRVDDLDDCFAYMRLASTAQHDPYTRAECEMAIRERRTDDSFWAVEWKGNHARIGDLCYRKGAYHTYEIAYDFHEAYARRGFATEACERPIEHIFLALEGRRLSVGRNEENEASWRLLERLGLRREAHCIEDAAFQKDADGNPIYVNSFNCAMLRREWMERHSARPYTNQEPSGGAP